MCYGHYDRIERETKCATGTIRMGHMVNCASGTRARLMKLTHLKLKCEPFLTTGQCEVTGLEC